MQPYANNSGKSNVLAYYLGGDFIVVQFPHSSYYKYTYSNAGKAAIETMKRCAQNGSGLGTFISSKDTQPDYAIKGPSLESVL